MFPLSMTPVLPGLITLILVLVTACPLAQSSRIVSLVSTRSQGHVASGEKHKHLPARASIGVRDPHLGGSLPIPNLHATNEALPMSHPDVSIGAAPVLRAQPKLDDKAWVALHQDYAAQTQGMTRADVIFYGDSITEGWTGLFKGKRLGLYKGSRDVFLGLGKRLGLKMHSFGIAGDTLSNLLWRVENGELPKSLRVGIAVVGIGINDVLQGAKPQTVASQTLSLLQKLRQSHPRTKFLLLGLLPESSGNGTTTPDTRPGQVNSLMSKGFTGDSKAQFTDCRRYFTDDKGFLVPSNYIKDGAKYLHLSEQGYKVFSYCLFKAMRKMLKEKAR